MSDEPQLQKTISGCKHYKRRCVIVSPCCGKIFGCRLCHNETETHEIDRKKISHIVCINCASDSPQEASDRCAMCGVTFAEYYCSICKLWDDEGYKKNIYHCEGCGICRIGPENKYFHCNICCACYPISLKGNHICIDGAMQNSCPICLEDMFSSRRSVIKLNCGHNIHSHCQSVMRRMDLLQSIRCPSCNKTIADEPGKIWRELENHIEQHPMPDDVKQLKVSIHCNDCNSKTSNVALNLIAMKCESCGSFNTNRD